jgi:hypothetical protein
VGGAGGDVRGCGRAPAAARRLRQDEEVRRYAFERDLALLEEQLVDRGRASGDP